MRKSAAVMCVIQLVGLLLLSAPPSVVWGANASPSPDFNDPAPPRSVPTEEQRAMEKSVDIAPEPPAPPEALLKLGYFHKYRNGLSALAFGVYDSKVEQDGGSLLTRGSLLYLFNDSHLRFWEAGADLLSDGTGGLSFARRWIYTKTRFRPFTKAGVGVRIDPNDQLTTFLRFKNYQLRGSMGFEVLVKVPISLRVEFEGTASTEAVQGLGGAGLTWAW